MAMYRPAAGTCVWMWTCSCSVRGRARGDFAILLSRLEIFRGVCAFVRVSSDKFLNTYLMIKNHRSKRKESFFSLAICLPSIVPSFLPLAVGEPMVH